MLLAAAYCLPWLVGPGAGLSLNAVDLAEWVSLHPATRVETPPLTTPLLLRLPLILIGAVMIVCIRQMHLRLLIVVSVPLALMPPVAFFASAGNDPNYLQQFMLALAAVVLLTSLALISRLCAVCFAIIAASIGAVGLSVTAMGVLQAYHIVNSLGYEVAIGAGGLLTAGLFLAFTVLFVLSILKNCLS